MKMVLLLVAVGVAWWVYKSVVGGPKPSAKASLAPQPAAAAIPRLGPGDVQIDPETIFARQQEGRALVLVDVREAAELGGGMIEGAVHVPAGQIDTRFTEFHPSDEIVLYCASGVRSTNAALFMRGKGYDKVWSLVGGFGHWQRDGGKVQGPPA